jgi:Xaa-Pro aminopeptidase
VSDVALPDLVHLPPMEVAGRAGRLREALGATEGSAQALLVTKLVNIRWLTGFTGSAAILLVLPDDRLLFVTDGRYAEQAADQLAAAGVEAEIRMALTAAGQYELLGAAASGLVLGVEADHITWAQERRLDEHFPHVAALVPTEGVVAALRQVKDGGEVARIEAAASVASVALDRVGHLLYERVTENDFGLALDTEIRRLGAEGNSFPTIVASGPNGAKPHHRAAGSPRVIVEGDLVVLDYGALVDGYCSDMTRTVAVGPVGDTETRMYEVVRAAQAAGVAAVRPGATSVEVDAACRSVIGAAGWAEAFTHGTGHGVGLEIHEDPRVSWSVTATLEAGQVVTVEPGVYLAGLAGVRIEDTLVVTGGGSRPLTHSPKNPDFRSW